MLKRKWVIILAVVAVFTLVIAGTAMAGSGPQSRTNSTVVPSSSTTCVPSTTCTRTSTLGAAVARWRLPVTPSTSTRPVAGPDL